MNTRALGHAFLMPTGPTRLQGNGNGYGNGNGNGNGNGDPMRSQQPEAAKALTPEAAAAFDAKREAKRLYMAVKARYEDIAALVGSLKADEILGQAAANVTNADAAYLDAVARGA